MPVHTDAVHLAPVPHTEFEPPVERHDGSDLFGGCPLQVRQGEDIILDALVVGVLTGYDCFPDRVAFPSNDLQHRVVPDIAFRRDSKSARNSKRNT